MVKREETVAKDSGMLHGLSKGRGGPLVTVEREHEFDFVSFYIINDSGNFH